MDPGLEHLRVHPVWRVFRFQWQQCSKDKGVSNKFSKCKDNIRNFNVSQKVWVGGLTDAVTWKALQELADTVGKSKWVEILGKGQACVCYGTAEEAQTAIATLNGSSLQFDVWTNTDQA